MADLMYAFYGILMLLATFFSALAILYSRKLVKNFKKNEKFALLMIFTQPKSPKAFKTLCISLLIFVLFVIITMIFPYETWLAWIGTQFAMIGILYFFKSLAEITEEEKK